MVKFEIGIVVDLNNYNNYFSRFASKYHSKTIEFHVLERDIDDKFTKKIADIKKFILKNDIENVSFHSPDRIIQSVMFEESSEKEQEDKIKFYMLIDELKSLSRQLKKEVILVLHQGIKIKRDRLDKMDDKEIEKLTKELLAKAKQSYNSLIDYTKDSMLLPMLENSPPSCASEPSEHFMDLAFEDIEDRIANNGFVLDLSHAAMCIEYYKQNTAKFRSLEKLKKIYGKIPYSLQSMEKYIKKSAKNIRWIHINDANGIFGHNEGLALGAKDSIIDFKKIIELIKKEVPNPKGVIEIVDSHKDYSLIESSAGKFIEYEGG